ncbi:MAG TPA: DUF2807 domain-containing protein [Aggregatilineales bacterium]|nr:DUF2807 domain-containing protein [Aggregatilineales bacterium]
MVRATRVTFHLLAISAVALVAACNYNPFGGPNTVSGTINSESRTVSGFSAVSLETSGGLSISVTGTESLTISADSNVLPLLTSDVSGNRLTLGTKPNTKFQCEGQCPIRYVLTMKDLNDLVLDGSGNVTISGLAASNFSATINGSGGITAQGKADNLIVNVNGSGSFDGKALSATTATVNDSGSGNVVVQVSDKLNATVSGSGSVRYIGNPTVNSNVNGSGSVTKQ